MTTFFFGRRGWVAKHEKRARKFSKPTNTNEEVVSQEGKGYLY